MKRLRFLPQRRVAPIAAVVVALSAGGIGIAQGSSQPPVPPAKAAKAKKRHALNVAYKTDPLTVIDEGEGTTDATSADYATLAGRPFGSYKAHLDETRYLTWDVPGQYPREDFGATLNVSFVAAVRGSKGRFGKFRGFYDYHQVSDGDLPSPIAGVITSGTGMFKGAGGRFDLLGLVVIKHDPVQLAGRWSGFLRY